MITKLSLETMGLILNLMVKLYISRFFSFASWDISAEQFNFDDLQPFLKVFF